MIPSPAIQADNIVSKIGTFGGVEGKDKEYYEVLKSYYFNYGFPKWGWAWKQARNYAKTLPNYGIKNSDEKEIRENARKYCSKKQGMKGLTFADKTKVTDNDIDREVLRLHFQRMTQTS